VMEQARGCWADRDEDSVAFVDRLRSASRWDELFPEMK
jgi:hypothetical protein